MQSRGDSDTLALPAGTKSVQEPEASVGSSTVAARGHIDESSKNQPCSSVLHRLKPVYELFLKTVSVLFQEHSITTTVYMTVLMTVFTCDLISYYR